MYRVWSNKPIVEVYDVNQDSDKFFKPLGLWFEVVGDYDWKWWCKSEMPEWMESFKYVYKIIFNENAKILRLTNDSEVLNLNKKYPGYLDYPDWVQIAREYGGIEIAPYSWELRFNKNCGWYYTWDCASGCLWNKNAVKDLILLDLNKEKGLQEEIYVRHLDF